MSRPTPTLPPGFRFHPTDEELIVHYLMNQAASVACPVPIIAEVDIYKFDPWNLPGKASFGEREWYFFSPRDRKYPNGVRPNRAAASGYWKATGTDKAIFSTPGKENIGVKKALVFYRGKPPKGVKTDWIMHEYRLTGTRNNNTNKSTRHGGSSMRLDDWVLCRIYKKGNNYQFMEQEQEDSTVEESLNMPSSPKPAAPLNLTKSCSLTDLLNNMDYSMLSQLLEGSSDDLEPSHNPLNYTTPYQTLNYNNVNNNYMSQEAYSIDHNNVMKRKREVDTSSLEDGNNFSRAAKKQPSDSRSTNYCNQFESFQYSLLNQPFLNQQLLLNTHLEMQ